MRPDDASCTNQISSSSAPAPAATPPRSTPPTSAWTSRSSIARPIPAACASIAAASRRRRCCTSPSWSRRRGTPRPGASSSARRRSISTSCARARTQVVGQLTGGTGQLVKARKIKYLRGTATLTGPTSLDVAKVDGGSEQVIFQHAIIAIGSQPAKVPGLVHRQPAHDGLHLGASNCENVPGSLLVVGGGYIGLELGSVYAALGSKVTVVEMMPGLLPGADRDLVAVLAKRIDKAFDAVLLSTKVVGVTEQKDGIKVSFEDALRRAARSGVRQGAGVGGPQAEPDARPRQDEGRSRRARLHQGRRAPPDRRADASTPSATSPASRCSRTRPVARGARRGRSHPRRGRGLRAGGDSGGRLHGSRAGVGRPDRDRGEEARPEGRGRRSFPGPRRAAHSRSIAPTG